MTKREENIIEITIIVSKMLEIGYIVAIPYLELKDIIVDIADSFEKVYHDTDWNEFEYYDEITKYTNKEMKKKLLDKFKSVPVNPDTGKIEIDWNGSYKGTPRTFILECIDTWFEKEKFQQKNTLRYKSDMI